MIQTGNANFWKFQIAGWATVALANLFIQAIAGLPVQMLLFNATLPFISGFIISTIYRYLIKRSLWRLKDLKRVVVLIIASTLLLTTTLLIVAFGIDTLFIHSTPPNLAGVLSNFMIFGLIFLLWNFIYFCVHYFNNWHQAELEKWKLASEMKDAQLGSLKSQINPHFIFNTLNNIRSLILEDKEKARDMLLNFSDLFRYSLNHSEQTQVPLPQELEMVNQYMELLSIQFEDKLDFQLQVDKGLEGVKIPPMMLQLLVENAIKHGISQFKDGGLVHIDIQQKNNFLLIDVKNSGQLSSGASLGSKLGVGIQNIKKRLDLLYNGNASLHLNEKDNFVIASIQIPVV